MPEKIIAADGGRGGRGGGRGGVATCFSSNLAMSAFSFSIVALNSRI